MSSFGGLRLIFGPIFFLFMQKKTSLEPAKGWLKFSYHVYCLFYVQRNETEREAFLGAMKCFSSNNSVSTTPH